MFMYINISIKYIVYCINVIWCVIAKKKWLVICAYVCACAIFTLWSLWPCYLRITARFFILAFVAICRGCELLVEQPGSSLMIHCPYVQFLALVIQPLRWGFVRLRDSQHSASFECLDSGIQNRRAKWCFLCLFGLVCCGILVFL